MAILSIPEISKYWERINVFKKGEHVDNRKIKIKEKQKKRNMPRPKKTLRKHKYTPHHAMF